MPDCGIPNSSILHLLPLGSSRSRTVTGTCEAIAWCWAFGVRSVLATQNDIHNRPPLWLTDGVKPNYSLVPPFRYWPHVDG